MIFRLLAVAAVSALAACATPTAGKPPAMAERGMLVDAKRMTLYTYDADKKGSGKSSCNGVCAVNWPPFMVAGNAAPVGDYSVVTRDDGKAQWAFKGQPLYYWPEDQEPGDTYGDNYKNVWHIVKP